MASLPKSPVILRFYLGRGLMKARKTSENTSRSILKNVALQYAEGAYDQFRKDALFTLQNDLRMELEHMGVLFRRHIIGFAGRRSSPSGFLDTVTKGEGAPRRAIAAGLPPWAPRNAQYLQTKRYAVGHMRWFDNTGWRIGPDLRYKGISEKSGSGPDNPGLLKSFFQRDVWETMFGPISVRFFRKRKIDGAGAQATLSSGAKKVQITIGSMQVRALGKIEPYMLPGFTSGNVVASAGGNLGLMNVVAQTDPRIAYRLGTMRNGVYRPTLEPFLGFYLTKVIPFVVEQRFRKGTLGSIIIK